MTQHAPAPLPPRAEPPNEFALRIGTVPYLNVQPLIWAFGHDCDLGGCHWPHHTSIVPAAPRELAALLEHDAVDVAIAPVFEALRHPVYTVIPGVSIATRGDVASVMLYCGSALETVAEVWLDPASLTSVNLVRVLLGERGVAARFGPPPADWDGAALPPGCAALMIGDRALAAHGRFAFEYDLGRLWVEATGLPFVFAAWFVHPAARCLPLNDVFARAKREGLARLEEVAADVSARFGFDLELVHRYYRDNLCYELGDEELRGMQHFARLCVRHGLLAAEPRIALHEY